jgi:hypothetical protein
VGPYKSGFEFKDCEGTNRSACSLCAKWGVVTEQAKWGVVTEQAKWGVITEQAKK